MQNEILKNQDDLITTYKIVTYILENKNVNRESFENVRNYIANIICDNAINNKVKNGKLYK